MPARKQKNKKKHHHQQQQQRQQSCTTTTSSTSTGSSGTVTPNTATPDVERHDSATTQLPYKVEKSDILGRCLVASRDLKPGELVITEEPLAIGPCVSANTVCLGCYMPVELDSQQYRCPSCKWLMCSAQCRGFQQSNGHTAYECQLLQQHNTAALLNSDIKPKLTQVKNLYELILVLRILLLKQHAPLRYEKILCMESHLEQRKCDAELWKHYEENVVLRLQRDWGMAAFDATEIHTICGIIDVNCFEIGQNSAKARTLYPSAFLLAHDCCSNTTHSDDPQTYAIVLRTSRLVRRNEPLTLSYAYTLQGTLKRRDFMYAGKLFWCLCSRCADPKELGTDCSALICSKCKNGAVRSTEALNQDADWKCDRCVYTLPAKNIVKLLDSINFDLESIDVHNIAGLENFLKRYAQVLHPNQYLLLSAKYTLCQLYGRIEGSLLHLMSVEELKRKEKYCRDFLRVADVLEPGLTRLRGIIMYELHGAVMMLAQRQMGSGRMQEKEFKRHIKEVVKLLQESRDILKMEPVGSSEYEMGVAAANALLEMGIV